MLSLNIYYPRGFRKQDFTPKDIFQSTLGKRTFQIIVISGLSIKNCKSQIEHILAQIKL